MTDPTFPLIIQGTVYDLDGSTIVENATVSAKNLSSDSNKSVLSNENGTYVLDLANTGSYSEGDIISMRATKDNEIIVSDFTLTSDIIDAGATTQDLTLKGIRQHTFRTFYDLINDNLPPNFTDSDGSTSISWSITSAMPEKVPTFPVMVLSPASVTVSLQTLKGKVAELPTQVTLEYYSRARFGKGQLDAARDYIQQVLLNNEDVLNYSRIFLERGEDMLDESNVDMLDLDNQKYNIANQIINARYYP